MKCSPLCLENTVNGTYVLNCFSRAPGDSLICPPLLHSHCVGSGSCPQPFLFRLLLSLPAQDSLPFYPTLLKAVNSGFPDTEISPCHSPAYNSLQLHAMTLWVTYKHEWDSQTQMGTYVKYSTKPSKSNLWCWKS